MAETLQNISTINRLVYTEGATFGETTYRPGATLGPRIQDDFQLVGVVSGSVTIQCDEQELQVPSNHIALLRPGEREFFQFDSRQSTNHNWCAVNPSHISLVLQESLRGSARVLPLSSRLEKLIATGLEFTGASRIEECIQQLGLACLHIYQYEAGSASRVVFPDLLNSAILSIEESLSERLSIESVAEKVGISSQHLIRLFRKHLQTTPGRFIWELRTKKGMVLLRETGLRVGEISDRLGFSTPFHFARLIKKAYGSSPKELRAQAWNLPSTSSPASFD